MRRSAIVVFAVFIATSFAVAQVPYVPAELLDTRIKLQGDHVTTCIFESRDTSAFDMAAADLVADALLLSHDIIELPVDYTVFADADLEYDLYLRLMNDCDLVAGISLTTDMFPDWLTITAPYATVPFVTVTLADHDYANLSDIPLDEAVGVQVGSLADMNFLGWHLNLPAQQRRQRMPYSSNELMMARLDDGTIAAAFIWLPNLLTKDGWQQGNYRIIDSYPVPVASVNIGFATFVNQNWLLGQVDAAINELHASGALVNLAVEHGIVLPDGNGLP